MAGGSMRKKAGNKRSNPIKPHQPPSPMAFSPAPSVTSKVVVFVSVLSVVAVISVIGISSHTWSSFRSTGDLSCQINSIEVINEFPHDPAAFTQGLLYGGNDTLFESTGLEGHSSVRKVDLRTGKIEMLEKMDDSDFGEGLTLLGERLYQVIWLHNTGYVYDRDNLKKLEKFTHHMKDGWGLATDGKVLFGSDGSSSLYKIDPQTMKVISEHLVKYNGHEVHNLNELEYINNEVWANIWMSDCIARISPAHGNVVGWILLPELSQGLLAAGNKVDVLNGIAWDEDKKRIFVTGKLWPKLFEIKLKPLKKPLRAPIEQICLRAPFRFSRK